MRTTSRRACRRRTPQHWYAATLRSRTRLLKLTILRQAKLHGNKPSRGAEIDKELQDEEAEILAKKDAKK